MKPSANRLRNARRDERWRDHVFTHPRCVICSAPIVPKPGRNLSARTCGKRSCSVARHNWMRPPTKHGRRHCEECHGMIPEERNANSIYCSRLCNARHNGRITSRRRRARLAA